MRNFNWYLLHAVTQYYFNSLKLQTTTQHTKLPHIITFILQETKGHVSAGNDRGSPSKSSLRKHATPPSRTCGRNGSTKAPQQVLLQPPSHLGRNSRWAHLAEQALEQPPLQQEQLWAPAKKLLQESEKPGQPTTSHKVQPHQITSAH